MELGRPLAVLAMVLATSCRERDDRSKITAPNDPTKPSLPAPSPETPMVTSVASGVASIAPPTTVHAPPPDAVVSSSGLASKMLVHGTGAKPGPTSQVKVHYTGWTTDGKMFDSSVVRGGAPPIFPVNALIRGFSEALQLMAVGETRRVWIPANLAYGDKPRPGAPSGMLVFDIALLEITTP